MRARELTLSGILMLSLSGCGMASVATAPLASTAAIADAAVQAAPAESASPAPEASQAAPATPAQASPAAAPASPAASAASAPAQPVGPAVTPTPAVFRLPPLTYIRQTLNNCGPASIAEVLHYWGVERTQGQTMAVLRPDGNSRGMMPYPVPGYIHSLGMNALMGIGGNPTMVKALVTNGFPVIVAQLVSLQEPVAHYREIEGFNDETRTFVSTDSYLGPNHQISYDEFDKLWARGNQRFMVIYPPDKEPLLNAVMKSVGWDKTAVYQNDLARQQRGDNVMQMEPPGAYRPNFPGSGELNQAWDYIQLGQPDQAKALIAKAPANARNAQLIDWLNQAMAVPTA
jgi:hypothetical protein